MRVNEQTGKQGKKQQESANEQRQPYPETCHRDLLGISSGPARQQATSRGLGLGQGGERGRGGGTAGHRGEEGARGVNKQHLTLRRAMEICMA